MTPTPQEDKTMNTEIMTDLPGVGCLAELDTVIEAKINDGTLQVGPIAQWESQYPERNGKVIHVLGRWCSQTSAYLNLAIRWQTDTKKGMFGRGLACYGQSLNWDNVLHLPLVK